MSFFEYLSRLFVRPWHQVELRGQGKVSMRQGQSILEAFLRAKTRYPFSCRIGECGTCKSLLLSGEVKIGRHNRAALSEMEASAGIFLACCSTALSDCVIAIGKPLKEELLKINERGWREEEARTEELDVRS